MSDYLNIGNWLSSGVQALGNAFNSGAQAVGNAISSGVQAVGNAVGSAAQALADLAERASWNQYDKKEIKEYSLRMSHDVSMVKSNAKELIRGAAIQAAVTAKELQVLAKLEKSEDVDAILDELDAITDDDPKILMEAHELARPLQEWIDPREVGGPMIGSQRSNSSAHRRADDGELPPVSGGQDLQSWVTECLKRFNDRYQQLLDHYGERAKKVQDKLKEREKALRDAWQALKEHGDTLWRAQANQVADKVVNYGAGGLTALAVGMSLGLSGVPILAVTMVGGVVLGSVFGRNWHFFG